MVKYYIYYLVVSSGGYKLLNCGTYGGTCSVGLFLFVILIIGLSFIYKVIFLALI